MVTDSGFNTTRDINADIPRSTVNTAYPYSDESNLKRSIPHGGYGKGGSPDRKRGRGTLSPQGKKYTINIRQPLTRINQEDSVGLPVYDDESVLGTGHNNGAMSTSTKGVTFVDRASQIRQNKNLSNPYSFAPPDNKTLFTSPVRTNRSSYNEVDPVQKLNSILKRLEKVLETLLT